MSDDTILLERRPDGVATLTLNRPHIHNAFDDALIGALTLALRELERSPGVRVVVIAASGRSFSAGADLNWMQRMARFSEAENLRDAMALAELMRTLRGLSKPTVARVQGAAIGGGVGLVACCDIAVASSEAQFCLSEVRLGLIPSVISPYVIAAMGERAVRRYFLTAERFDAQEALRVNLVQAVAAPESLDLAVGAVVANLLKGGPMALARAKDLITRVAGHPIDEALIEDTASRIASTRVSAEGQEGMNAFLGKRPAAWLEPS